jgi:hypothetical protein
MRRAVKVIGLALAGICLAAPSLCHAKNDCPWLNEATASGFLGGSALGDFTAAATGKPAVCTFVEQEANFTRTLTITVEIAADAHARMSEVAQICGAGASTLKAIGNEALVCPANDRKAGMGERVVGRVRDQVFTVTIGTTLKDDQEMTRDALIAKIGTAAEQVAGNLF